MIGHDELAAGLARLQRSKAKKYSDGQREEIGRVVLDWQPEKFREAVDYILHTHETQALPTPAHFVKAVGDTRRGDGRTWAEQAAGSSKSDRARPFRIGEVLAAARLNEEICRIDYYESLVQHMTQKDRDMARDGEKSLTDTEGSASDSAKAFARAYPEVAERMERERDRSRDKRDPDSVGDILEDMGL